MKSAEAQDAIKRGLSKTGSKGVHLFKGIQPFMKSIVPALKAAPVVDYFLEMKDTAAKPNKTETDIRKMGEDSLRMLIHGASMIAGAYIGGDIGAAAGLAIGAPTGPGVGVTIIVGATGGAVAGCMFGDYVSGWVADKVAHFGGDIAMNLYDYSSNHDNPFANFLREKLF